MSIMWSWGLRAAEMGSTNSGKENGNGKGIQTEHSNPSTAVQPLQSSGVSMHSSPEGHRLNEKAVKYMECLRNHAAAIGGHATDGCGEFMAGGEEGTIEALKCSACNCHRNFHKRVIEGQCSSGCFRSFFANNPENNLISAHHKHHHKCGGLVPEILGCDSSARLTTNSKKRTQQVTVMSPHKFESNTPETGEQEEGIDPEQERPIEVEKKRYRTKFSQEQKEKMWSFAQKAGWKIQNLDGSEVHHFCQDIGIQRRVLKVWMHNNKHSLAKKNSFPC